MLFEEFGLQYFGPIDGHNLPLLVETFKFLKAADRPVLLHVLTQKGRGFQPALDRQKKFHGLGPYDPETGMTEPAGLPTYAEVFANYAGRPGRQGRAHRGHHGGHAQRHRTGSLPAASSQALL